MFIFHLKRYLLLGLTSCFLWLGCPEDTPEPDDDKKDTPKTNVPVTSADAGPTPVIRDAGVSAPSVDSGTNPQPEPVLDSGVALAPTTDAGSITNILSDAGASTMMATDAGHEPANISTDGGNNTLAYLMPEPPPLTYVTLDAGMSYFENDPVPDLEVNRFFRMCAQCRYRGNTGSGSNGDLITIIPAGDSCNTIFIITTPLITGNNFQQTLVATYSPWQKKFDNGHTLVCASNIQHTPSPSAAPTNTKHKAFSLNAPYTMAPVGVTFKP